MILDNRETLLEVCCGSAEDVLEAAAAGADRVELNSDLFHGGLRVKLQELCSALGAEQAVHGDRRAAILTEPLSVHSF